MKKPSFTQTQKVLIVVVLGLVLAYLIMVTAPQNTALGQAIRILKVG